MKQETISKAKAAQLFAENAVLFGRADGSRPYSKTAETGKQLGRREQTETVLIAKTAYKVYAEYTAHPLARLTLWSVLEQIGTIEARERDSAPMVASFKECKAGAIYIKNEKIERR